MGNSAVETPISYDSSSYFFSFSFLFMILLLLLFSWELQARIDCSYF